MNPQQFFLFPLKKELRTFLNHFPLAQAQEIKTQNGTQTLFITHSQKSFFAVGGLGGKPYAQTLHNLKNHFPSIQSVWCLGSAGGLSPLLSPGDVVIATQSITLDNLPIPTNMLPKSPLISENYNYQIFQGSILSVNKAIDTPEEADALYNKTQALAVAWEGYDGAIQARALGLNYGELRGITDDARHQVSESFTINLNLAMENLANTVMEFFDV